MNKTVMLATLMLLVGKDFVTARKPPPMGFNTWNQYGCGISEELMRTTADAMVSTGLLEAGYEYLNMDDCWASKSRNADGSIEGDNKTFPSGIKALAAYAHGKGLKFGLYTAEDPTTCAGRAGSYKHELQDAKTYCDWGIDYVKIDHCGDGLHAWPHMNQSWVLFRQGFDDCVASGGNAMVMSVEYCTVNVPACAGWFINNGEVDHLRGCAAWLTEAKVDLWRVRADISPDFNDIIGGATCSSMSRELSVNLSNPLYGFNDPDIMEVGNDKLSFAEQKSHFSLWCILAAPLLISTDLSSISNATLSILKAKEVIAVNQDPLGIQGMEVNCTSNATAAQLSDPQAKAWLKPMSDGSHALLLLNTRPTAQHVSVTWEGIGLGKPGDKFNVRDLWAEEALGGGVADGFGSAIEGHGVVLVGITNVGP